MKRTVFLAAWVAAMAIFAANGPLAWADDQETLIRQGVELRRQGKEQDALALFEKAVAIKKTPRALGQLGLAEQSLGLWVKAELHLKAAIEGAGDPWIVKNRRVIDESLATIQSHLGSLAVWGSPAGADVIVDGQSIGTLPTATIRMPLGDTSITVRHDGYADVTRLVQISRGGIVRENVDLHPVPAHPRVALEAATDVGAPAVVAAPTLVAEQKEPSQEPSDAGTTSPEDRPVYKRWWFWAAVGVVAVGAGTSAYLLTHRGSTQSNGCTDPGMCASW